MQGNCFRGAFQGKTVVVTGHTGFKGSWLAIWLKEMGARVLGFGLDPSPEGNYHLCRLGEKRGIGGTLKGDVTDPESLASFFAEARPEVVFHLAAQPIVVLSFEKPRLTFDINAMGTVNVLDAVRQCPSVKAVVVVTTDKVYENREWVWGYRENDALGGFDPYAASKAMAELAVGSYRQSWPKLAVACPDAAIGTGRSGNVIGGGDFGAYRLVPDCMKSFLRGQAMVLRNPLAARPWQFVLEALSGYLSLASALLGKWQQPGRAYAEGWNFGPSDPRGITCEEVVVQAAKTWGMKGKGWRLQEGAIPVHETNVLRLNWDKAAHGLGWRPVYTWQEAVDQTVEWFKVYQSQLTKKGASSVDMFATCRKQIGKYASCARKQGLWWAQS